MNAQESSAAANTRALAVDLDGTLIKGDMMAEAAASLVTKNPLYALCLPLWALRGRAFLKEKIAALAPPVLADTLPYRHNFLEWLREQQQKRPLILATAAHRIHADAVAEHLGIFSRVVATEHGINLAGENKARRLAEICGEKEFDYAGNSAADLAVWEKARAAAVVCAPDGVVKRIKQSGAQLIYEVPREGLAQRLQHWRRAARPRHWLKNLLLFAAAVGGHQLLSPPVMAAAALGFVVFGLLASASYLLNDIFDLRHDRAGANKSRPLAAGDIGVLQSCLAAAIMYVAAACLAFYLPPAFALVAAFYAAATLVYSFWLKRALLLDVLSLAVFFTARIVAGGAAAEIELSFYLLSFSLFIFLSLALLKRHGELLRLSENDSASGRAYRKSDANIVAALGAAAGMISIFVLTLYLDSAEVRARYDNPEVVYFTLPLMVYWISRMWLLSSRGGIGGDPIVFVLRDRPSVVCGALMMFLIWLSA